MMRLAVAFAVALALMGGKIGVSAVSITPALARCGGCGWSGSRRGL